MKPVYSDGLRLGCGTLRNLQLRWYILFPDAQNCSPSELRFTITGPENRAATLHELRYCRKLGWILSAALSLRKFTKTCRTPSFASTIVINFVVFLVRWQVYNKYTIEPHPVKRVVYIDDKRTSLFNCFATRSGRETPLIFVFMDFS